MYAEGLGWLNVGPTLAKGGGWEKTKKKGQGLGFGDGGERTFCRIPHTCMETQRHICSRHAIEFENESLNSNSIVLRKSGKAVTPGLL